MPTFFQIMTLFPCCCTPVPAEALRVNRVFSSSSNVEFSCEADNLMEDCSCGGALPLLEQWEDGTLAGQRQQEAEFWLKPFRALPAPVTIGSVASAKTTTCHCKHSEGASWRVALCLPERWGKQGMWPGSICWRSPTDLERTPAFQIPSSELCTAACRFCMALRGDKCHSNLYHVEVSLCRWVCNPLSE